MERIHLDFLGPLPMSKKKNLLILIMIDRFTKWVEYNPLSNQTVESTVKAANEFFLDFSFPLPILTDRGSVFESAFLTVVRTDTYS